jgi:hypothetical protein
MSSQGIMTGKKASYNPGLVPIKGQKFDPCTWAGIRVLSFHSKPDICGMTNG